MVQQAMEGGMPVVVTKGGMNTSEVARPNEWCESLYLCGGEGWGVSKSRPPSHSHKVLVESRKKKNKKKLFPSIYLQMPLSNAIQNTTNFPPKNFTGMFSLRSLT